MKGLDPAPFAPSAAKDQMCTLIGDGPVTPLLHEVFTGFGEPARMVVRDSQRWTEVWARTFAGRSEAPPRPSIDFSREIVLVAAQGAQASGGYDISIDRVATINGGMAVDVTSISPDQRCATLAVMTSPVIMVRIPRSPSHVQFIEHTRVISCN